ncbi:MAG: hypothetical protein HN658_10860 [Rhodospirillales bacterium]|jgi:hypothetical protein|nr:hypothetical protein [Rhodospirillales bacterium]MBT4006269.1 hypothetical protein [Rhodospirillales bacterium]MBT5075657.1 hypothetical protein [Rhodospirillales bacterium]MBT5112357.1 hypothetical protein [Rhodospirillales bacterium]MBT5672058.1 hypothetical protein [Rhodospirillales bacterium]
MPKFLIRRHAVEHFSKQAGLALDPLTIDNLHLISFNFIPTDTRDQHATL